MSAAGTVAEGTAFFAGLLGGLLTGVLLEGLPPPLSGRAAGRLLGALSGWASGRFRAGAPFTAVADDDLGDPSLLVLESAAGVFLASTTAMAAALACLAGTGAGARASPTHAR